MTLRNRLALSGLVGIAGGAALMGGALFVLQRSGLTPLITGRGGILALLGFVLFFSLAEIPMMIYALRKLTASAAGVRPALVINAAFTFFSAVYAAPFLLLTGQLEISLALAGLCLVRLAGALWLGTPPDGG